MPEGFVVCIASYLRCVSRGPMLPRLVASRGHISPSSGPKCHFSLQGQFCPSKLNEVRNQPLSYITSYHLVVPVVCPFLSGTHTSYTCTTTVNTQNGHASHLGMPERCLVRAARLPAVRPVSSTRPWQACSLTPHARLFT
jgi:hypothetical protein